LRIAMEKIEKHTIRGEIGKGGMGVVSLGLDPLSGCPRAMDYR